MKLPGLLLAALTFVACSSATEPQPARRPPLVSPAATVEPRHARFQLTISNQSFPQPRALIAVTVDGRRLVAQEFDVEGQHNFVGFGFDLTPGRHELVATGPFGATRKESFELPASGKRYGVLLYWNDGHEKPNFSWTFGPDQPAFA